MSSRRPFARGLAGAALVALAACTAAPKAEPAPPAPPRSCMTGEGDACPPGEVCVEHRGGAPKAPGGTCTKIADACHGTPSCACMGSPCGAPAECAMAGPAHLICACRTCP